MQELHQKITKNTKASTTREGPQNVTQQLQQEQEKNVKKEAELEQLK